MVAPNKTPIVPWIRLPTIRSLECLVWSMCGIVVIILVYSISQLHQQPLSGRQMAKRSIYETNDHDAENLNQIRGHFDLGPNGVEYVHVNRDLKRQDPAGEQEYQNLEYDEDRILKLEEIDGYNSFLDKNQIRRPKKPPLHGTDNESNKNEDKHKVSEYEAMMARNELPVDALGFKPKLPIPEDVIQNNQIYINEAILPTETNLKNGGSHDFQSSVLIDVRGKMSQNIKNAAESSIVLNNGQKLNDFLNREHNAVEKSNRNFGDFKAEGMDGKTEVELKKDEINEILNDDVKQHDGVYHEEIELSNAVKQTKVYLAKRIKPQVNESFSNVAHKDMQSSVLASDIDKSNNIVKKAPNNANLNVQETIRKATDFNQDKILQPKADIEKIQEISVIKSVKSTERFKNETKSSLHKPKRKKRRRKGRKESYVANKNVTSITGNLKQVLQTQDLNITYYKVPKNKSYENVEKNKSYEHVEKTIISQGLPTHKLYAPSNGRLGNHMFQYASIYGIAKDTNRIPIILPNMEVPDVFKQTKHSLLIETLHEDNVTTINEESGGIFSPQLYSLPDKDVSICCYLQSWRYFQKYSLEVREMFQFRDWVAEEASRTVHQLGRQYLVQLQTRYDVARDGAYPTDIRNDITYIGVHVRRGDLLLPVHIDIGYKAAPESYVHKAMDYFRGRYPNTLFIVCSDDINWCRSTLQTPDVFFHDSGDYWVDLAVLSKCNHTVITVGTFGWWAAWLAGGDATYYSNWPANGTEIAKYYNHQDYFLPKWKPIGD